MSLTIYYCEELYTGVFYIWVGSTHSKFELAIDKYIPENTKIKFHTNGTIEFDGGIANTVNGKFEIFKKTLNDKKND